MTITPEVAEQKRAVIGLLTAIDGWRREPCGDLLDAITDIAERRDAGLLLVECGRLTLRCIEGVLLGSDVSVGDVLRHLGLDLATR